MTKKARNQRPDLLKSLAAKARRARIMQIRADLLRFEPAFQRRVIKARVKHFYETMNLDALHILTVSLRKTGDYIIVDGQHRALALLEHGFGEWKVKCNVYEDLTLEEEAELYLQLNDVRVVTPYDKFYAGLTAKDPECLEIRAICEGFGLRVGRSTGDTTISCVTTLRKIFRSSDNGRPGSQALAQALDLSLSAWGHESSALEGRLLEGLSIFLAAYGDVIDRAALINKLSKVGGKAAGLLGSARALTEHRRSSIPRCLASIVVDIYNKGRRTGTLPDL